MKCIECSNNRVKREKYKCCSCRNFMCNACNKKMWEGYVAFYKEYYILRYKKYEGQVDYGHNEINMCCTKCYVIFSINGFEKGVLHPDWMEKYLTLTKEDMERTK